MASSLVYLMDGKTPVAAPSVLDTYYVLEDGYLFQADTEAVYCRTCGDMQPAERIPSIADAEAAFTNEDRYTLKAVRNRKSMAYDAAMTRKRYYEWRLTRKAPPRCLKCSSHDLFVIHDNECCDPISGHTFVFHDCEFYDPCFPISIRLRPDGTILESNLDPVTYENSGEQ